MTDDTESGTSDLGPGETYRTCHDWKQKEAISTTVATALSEATRREPLTLRPLDQVINAEALDRLFSPAGDSLRLHGHVTFEFEGHDVTVHGNGKIVIAAAGDRGAALGE